MRILSLCLLLISLAFAPRAWAGGVDINTADASTLESLPGIGASKAAAIIQYRTEHGPFKTVDQLNDVSGIGDATLANLRDLVTVGAGSKAADGAAAAPAAKSESKAAASAASAAPAAAPAASAASAGGCPVNINTADAAGLDALPGIGESKAAAILQYRVDHGPFASCDALDAVSGIGASTLATLAPCCTVK